MEQQTSLKIYVVDDDLFSLNLYKQHLHNLGYENVSAFDNGVACLNALTGQPDIIFLDHGMDILNGVEVLKKIKRFNPDIYVVFISAQEDVSTAVNSLKYGAFDYIVKGDKDMQRMEAVLSKIIAVKEMLRKSNKGFIRKFFAFFL